MVKLSVGYFSKFFHGPCSRNQIQDGVYMLSEWRTLTDAFYAGDGPIGNFSVLPGTVWDVIRTFIENIDWLCVDGGERGGLKFNFTVSTRHKKWGSWL